jgi:hypothetical protein
MNNFTSPEWIGISLVILIMGMSKGGLPIAGVALPLLVLIWPEQGQAARSAVSFMLPLLCAMDLVGILLYRGKPDWSHIKMLLPATLAGVLVASLFFVSDRGISVSDQMLKLTIGALGLFFTGWHFWGQRFFLHNPGEIVNTVGRARFYGFFGGLTSTIAHAAGPVMQMYFLRTGLAKTQFAATTIYFFVFLNAVKLIPFALLGRFTREQLIVDLKMLPLIPVGVLLGYFIVRIMNKEHYSIFIYTTLFLTSLILVYRALSGS